MSYQAPEYWKEIYEQAVDAKAVCYPEWPLSYNQMLHQQQLQGLLQLMAEEKISLSNKHILEIGPGSGFWTQFFLHHPIASYTGVELTETATKNLQNKFPQHHFICSDVSAIKEHELSSEGYDFIFAAMVFLHITDDEKWLKAVQILQKALKPGGCLMVLDAVYQHRVFGWQRKQTAGKDFDIRMHNKIRRMQDWNELFATNVFLSLKPRPAFNLTQMCYDFRTYISYLIFGKFFYAIHRRLLTKRSEEWGKWYGKFIFRIDDWMTQTLKCGFSGKWMIWVRKEKLS
jgi:phospholipid N-methyltransferase